MLHLHFKRSSDFGRGKIYFVQHLEKNFNIDVIKLILICEKSYLTCILYKASENCNDFVKMIIEKSGFLNKNTHVMFTDY